MADEVLGSIYEVVTIVAIEDYTNIKKAGEQVFWEEYPTGVTIKPDVTIGKDKDNPRILFLIHHTNAESASHKKFWRNIGELVDARIALGAKTIIANIMFESLQKKKLITASEAIFDGFLEVGKASYGITLTSLTHTLAQQAIKDSVAPQKRIKMIRDHLKSNPSDESIVKDFAADIAKVISSSSKFASSWFGAFQKLQPGRPKPRIPKAKVTTIRRGLGRLLPIKDEAFLKQLLSDIRTNTPTQVPSYFYSLGLASPDISGKRFRVTDKETTLLANQFDDNAILDLLKNIAAASSGLKQTAVTIAESAVFPKFHNFVVNNYLTLSTTKGLGKALIDCYTNPDSLLGNPIGLTNPSQYGVWLFSYMMTIIKAHSKKQQGYGYTPLDREAGTNLGTGIGPHISVFVSRQKMLDSSILTAFSKAISARLTNIEEDWIRTHGNEIEEFYLKGLFEDGIYKSSKLDPLKLILFNSLKAKKIQHKTRQSTFLSQFSGKGTTTTEVILVNDTMILWQSASNKGVSHKMKELCGRLGMLRVTATSKGAEINSKYKKVILLLDGTWKDTHIKRLVECGADEIYYPDEMDLLVKAIV